MTITRRRVAQDVRDAATRGHGRGTVPAGLARWADDALAAPTVPWRKVLAGVMRRTAALTTGRTTYTYTRPGRRRLPGIITPALRAQKVTAAVVIDTSGSMGQDDLAAALAEVGGVVKAVGGSVRLLTCDAAASTARPVRYAREVELIGGGGTDMRVGIAAAGAMSPAPDVVVVITDGDTPWPARPSRARLVVVLTRDRALERVPVWARAVLAATA